ncbi:hypothetical protein FOZ60_013206 [Perkinsus olseni]|uniref:O-acyltransferase WSD1 C-terminal domain-containing protein n=1 Tax=Perkinsus olseni TaxID=32597 RepID=A0A7J6P9V7_PEROL|nr:hypothetical protein FOZ60_013206 [Perkinsus olseni]
MPMIELPQPTFSSAVVCVIVGIFTLKLVSVFLKRKGASASKSSRDDLDALSRCLVLFEDDKEEAVLFVHAAEIFQEKVAFAGFAEQFIRIYCGKGRFAQRLVQDDGDRPYWTQAADDWKPMDNISCIDEDITHEGLEKMLGDMCSTPLPTDKPLWRVVFLQNYKPRDSDVITSAFVWKYHHTIADGFTAMRHVVSHCTPVDETKTIEELFSTSRDVSARREKVSLSSIGTLISKFSNAVLKLVFLPKDPPNPCKPNYHLEKRSRRVCSFAGLGEEFSVKEIKKLARQASVGQSKKTTVNDILITAVFRTLAKYCEENPGKGGQTPEKLTAGMWVALNSGSPFEFAPTESKWGNEKLGVCYLNAPVKTIPAEEQLGAVHRGIRELIGSPEPYVANRVLSFFGALPHCIAKPWWDMTADKVTISLSNVPGPQAALRWPVNRHEDLKEQIPRTGLIRDLLFFVPPVLDVGNAVL